MKRNILARRAASAALAACMMFSLSAPALAASTDALLQQSTAAKSAVSVLDEENGTEVETEYQMNLKYGSIRVYIGADGKQYAQQGENDPQKRGNLQITTDGGRTDNTLTIEGGTTGAKVTLSNVKINASGAAVSVSGNVELVIAGTNTLQSGPKHAGVEKADDNGTLTISGTGTGTLEAYGGQGGAGIGSGSQKGCSNIVIESGTITAHGGEWGAGIGSGNVGGGGNAGVLGGSNITINDGDVKAYGGSEAAGIGGGLKGNGKDITINGGTVHAESGGGKGPVAAIGGGRVDGKGENIQITGGNVTLKTVDDDDIYIGNGQQEAEIDPSKLLGTITKLNMYDEQVDEIVQDFNIKINDKPVTRKNYEDILGLCYDIEEKTLKLKDGKSFEGALTITAPEDVSIDLEANASHVVNGNLIVNGAKDVKVTKLEGDDAAEGAIVAINGKAEISCSGDVILKNLGGSSYRGRNLTSNGLTVNGANKVTTEGSIGGQAIIDCDGDIKLGNEWGTTVSKLTVNRADNVTVTSGSVNWSIENGANITCSGTVEIKGETPIEGDVKIVAGKDVFLECVGDHDAIEITAAGKVELNSYRYSYSDLGKVIFTQANKKPCVYFTDQSSEYKDSRITPIPETIESNYLRIEPRETYSITVKNGTAQVVGDTDGKLTTAFEGEKVTVSGKNRNPDVTKFGGWKVVSPEGFELTEEQKNTEENMTFTMPDSPVELKASYSFPAPVVDMPVIVTGGTIRVGKGERQTGTVLVQPGQTVTIEANEPVKENESFHHWKVENGTSTAFAPTEGSLGSETEKGTEKIVFTMPQDGVKLTAVYSIPASVLRSTVTVTGGTAKSTLDEGSDIPAEIGTTVEITATPYDAEKYPGMEFVEWEIKYPDSFYEKFPGGIPENLQLKLDNAKSAATTFKMPVYPVKLIAHWSASPVAEPDPDEPIDEDFGVEPAPMDTTGGAIAAVAVGGAAIWGGYEIATRVILNDLLPEGAAIPANRGQLALLIWTEKGKPEPAAQPAFADITDAEQAKAAQWCVEQGLLDAREGKFESDGWMPKFKTIEIWNKAFPKK